MFVSRSMTRKVITVNPETTIFEAQELMAKHNIRHLPVVEDGELIGVISIGDVVKDLIEELQFMVTQLEKYIMGLR